MTSISRLNLALMWRLKTSFRPFYDFDEMEIWCYLTICYYHVTYAFQSASTLYSCLNVKELLAQSRREIWNLSDCNWNRTHNHLVHKRTLTHLAKLTSLAKWLSVCLWTKCLWVQVHLQSWCHLLVFSRLFSFFDFLSAHLQNTREPNSLRMIFD